MVYVETKGLRLAPQVGLEPTTLRLTAECSTIELLRIKVGDISIRPNAPRWCQIKPMHRLRTGFLAVLICAHVPALIAQDAFYLHDGDTVIFYGDSITDQRLYTTFTETFV